ncbi:uncharacterized protein LOC132549651 [Ylistrum balloti]|uniref:uncharacterized protein LOC132549651 n=1 Tax=Ylistrum balloti TaxID=509963 RepID=UPI0029059F58|nr:uncharacterized protein LOC132549651 [Ylistrum balloti]
MKICYLLLVLFVGFDWGLDDRTDQVPCFPTCTLSDEGRRLCESLQISGPCGNRNQRKREDRSATCSCEWLAMLSHPEYNYVPDKFGCLQYSLHTCDSRTRLSRDVSRSEYTVSDFLREIQNENARIEKLTDESEKRHAKLKLSNTVRDIVYLIRQIDANNKEKHEKDSTAKDTERTGTTDKMENQDRSLTGGWEKPAGASKQPMTKTSAVTKPTVQMFPLKNERLFHIAMFIALLLLILVVIVLFLVAKMKTDRVGANLDLVGDLDLERRRHQRTSWRIFLDKLRLHYRQKATENSKRGLSNGDLTSRPKIAKPPMAVPSKSSIGKKDSKTSLTNSVDKRTDSCTMISGLTHGNTTGSDVEIDNEFRMFRTNFKRDFKSLLNVNKEKQEEH